MKLLLDTNILIDYLNGLESARALIEDEQRKSISLITWMEVLVGARGPEEEAILEAWMGRFPILDVDIPVAREAVGLRRKHKIRLRDALIWATAQVHRLVLVTRNRRDFPSGQAGIHVPYRLPSP